MAVAAQPERPLTVTRTRPPTEEALLAAQAARVGDLTRLAALRAGRSRTRVSPS